MNLKNTISQYWKKIQGSLFPWLEEELPPLTEKQRQLVSILEIIRIEQFLPSFYAGFRGRPEKDRRAVARAFIAKAVYNMPTTTMLIERLYTDISLRRICGWEKKEEIPSESLFSRAFAEFAVSELPTKVHEALIKTFYTDEIVGHVITDASAIEAREKPAEKIKKKRVDIGKPKNLGGRPKKGQERPKEMTRIEKQASGLMTLEEMLNDLPKECDKGGKTNTKGNLYWWIGYKIHLTVDDHGVPLAGITSSASIHDSQVAIPLAKLTDQRVTSLYDLMDAGYYAPGIIEHSRALGHVPIIECPAERGEKGEKELEKKAWETLNLKPAEMVRYEIRTTVERVFSRLKGEFGANFVRVRGIGKVSAHLMFGVLVLAADQLLRIIR
jgi:transposase